MLNIRRPRGLPGQSIYGTFPVGTQTFYSSVKGGKYKVASVSWKIFSQIRTQKYFGEMFDCDALGIFFAGFFHISDAKKMCSKERMVDTQKVCKNFAEEVPYDSDQLNSAQAALQEAYARVENNLWMWVRPVARLGFSSVLKVGSCAISAVLLQNPEEDKARAVVVQFSCGRVRGCPGSRLGHPRLLLLLPLPIVR